MKGYQGLLCYYVVVNLPCESLYHNVKKYSAIAIKVSIMGLLSLCTGIYFI